MTEDLPCLVDGTERVTSVSCILDHLRASVRIFAVSDAADVCTKGHNLEQHLSSAQGDSTFAFSVFVEEALQPALVLLHCHRISLTVLSAALLVVDQGWLRDCHSGLL